MEQLKGKKALITGGRRGIGKAIAQVLTQLKLNRRALLKTAGLWSTNP
jgi:NAD(P)-dependent dehydrogenase (short-subunit alcohol dehydrogenase family)